MYSLYGTLRINKAIAGKSQCQYNLLVEWWRCWHLLRMEREKNGFSMASIMQHKNIPQRKCCLDTSLWQSANETHLLLGSCSPSPTLLNRFSTNKARVIYILKKPPSPLLWCCFARLFSFFPSLFALFPLYLHISREIYLPWRAPAWNFNERKTCSFHIWYLTPPPKKKKSPSEKPAPLSSVN